MRICTSAPKSTERGSLIVSFDALTGLFIAMGLVLGNIARKRGKKPVILAVWFIHQGILRWD